MSAKCTSSGVRSAGCCAGHSPDMLGRRGQVDGFRGVLSEDVGDGVEDGGRSADAAGHDLGEGPGSSRRRAPVRPGSRPGRHGRRAALLPVLAGRNVWATSAGSAINEEVITSVSGRASRASTDSVRYRARSAGMPSRSPVAVTSVSPRTSGIGVATPRAGRSDPGSWSASRVRVGGGRVGRVCATALSTVAATRPACAPSVRPACSRTPSTRLRSRSWADSL